MKPAIFLDRDGVLIENYPSYIRRWEDVQVFPQALAALALINLAPYKIVIVTNQSVVGRGLISLENARQINRQLVSVFEQAGGRIDGVFMCPHTSQDQCECRKPKPGMLFQAARELSLDLSRSLMIGDTLSDLQAGQAAGVYKTALVRTGLGASQVNIPQSNLIAPFSIYENVFDALINLIDCSPPASSIN
jgi:D-glycero-D-manno-heptose 1,7-bisphosphate phosphatase